MITVLDALLQVDCIHWVSAPQLALLETAMQKMERVHAWLLNTGGGSAINVFQACLIQAAVPYLRLFYFNLLSQLNMDCVSLTLWRYTCSLS